MLHEVYQELLLATTTTTNNNDNDNDNNNNDNDANDDNNDISMILIYIYIYIYIHAYGTASFHAKRSCAEIVPVDVFVGFSRGFPRDSSKKLS